MIPDEGIKDEFLAHEKNTYKLVHKIVDNVEGACLFMVLIKILMRPLDPSRWPSFVSWVPLAEKNYHYSRLVADTLDCMSKIPMDRGGHLYLARILQSIHAYLQQVEMKEILLFKKGMKGIKENSETETRGTLQYGLRAVMEVLKYLVNHIGSSIKYYLSMVPVYADPQPMIVAFIDLYLESMKGMEVICSELRHIVHSESIAPEYIINDADRLVSYLTIMVERTSKLVLSGADSSSYKYSLDTLQLTYRIRYLAHAVKEDTSENLMRELFVFVAIVSGDFNIPLDEDINEKYIPKLLRQLSKNVEAASMLVVLMKLLIRPIDPSRWPSCTSMSLEDKNDAYLKIAGGVLSTLAKVLVSSTWHIDIDRILQTIHTYFEQLGIDMEEIERRGETEDDPVAAVMKVLKRLVKLQGSVVKRHLSMVPLDADPQPIIVALIDSAIEKFAPRGYDEESDPSVSSDKEADPSVSSDEEPDPIDSHEYSYIRL